MRHFKSNFFLTSLPTMLVVLSLFTVGRSANAAQRTAIRGTGVVRQGDIALNPGAAASASATDSVIEIGQIAPVAITPISNESAQFGKLVSGSSNISIDDDEFARRIREQRAKLDARDAAELVDTRIQNVMAGRSICDMGLRNCMMQTCGQDFSQCATDGDTDFGIKLDKCRRNVKCSGEEFRLFGNEIKADRDLNIKLLSYNGVISCGDSYRKCLETECGDTFTKCLGQSATEKAISKCKSVADKCKEQDSGMPGRFGKIIGELRNKTEIEIAQDEKQLYTLRDSLETACTKLGATFDDRSFSCVYTVHFFAGDDQDTPKASRKRYAGQTFICKQEWFGIDVTTYKENAQRETRAQTGASSAMLGAGVGTAAGLIASGAMGRALDRQNAEKEYDQELKKECEKDGNALYEGGVCKKENAPCTTVYGGGHGTYKRTSKGMQCKLDGCKDAGYDVDKTDGGYSCTIVKSKKAGKK